MSTNASESNLDQTKLTKLKRARLFGFLDVCEESRKHRQKHDPVQQHLDMSKPDLKIPKGGRPGWFEAFKCPWFGSFSLLPRRLLDEAFANLHKGVHWIFAIKLWKTITHRTGRRRILPILTAKLCATVVLVHMLLFTMTTSISMEMQCNDDDISAWYSSNTGHGFFGHWKY